MKITPKQYAQTLYELSKDIKKEDVEKVISDFVRILFANNNASKLDKIIAEYNKIWNSEQGVVDAEIISVRELDTDIVKLLKNYIIKIAGAENIELKKKTDKNILGGVVIKYGDKILDASLRAKVNALKERMKK